MASRRAPLLGVALLVAMHVASASASALRGNPRALTALPTFPNIKYLGLGYNVVTGNPFTNGADPGFAPEGRQQMLKLTYNEGRQYDNQYAVPDGMNVINDASCSYSTDSHTSTSASDYQKALQTQMSFSASADDWFVNFEFSASADYQTFTSKNEKDNMVQVSATAHCSAYGADLDAFGWKPTFTDEFQGAVRALGESLEYGEFIKLFGTHYVKGMQMGGSSTYAATMKASSLAEMTRTNVDVSAGASLSFFAKVGADVSHSSKASDYTAFSSAVASDTLSGIPEPAPQCGGSMCSDYSAWVTAVSANPQPVNIKLASIVDILTPAYFPNDGNITTKAAALTSFLTNEYCGTVPGCAPAPSPPPRGPAVIMLSVEPNQGPSFCNNPTITNCSGIFVNVDPGTEVVPTGLHSGRCNFNVSNFGSDQADVSILGQMTCLKGSNIVVATVEIDASFTFSPAGWTTDNSGWVTSPSTFLLECPTSSSTAYGTVSETLSCYWFSAKSYSWGFEATVHM